MVFKSVYLFPILLGFWLPATFLVTYFLSVANKHITPVLSYISHAGTWAPESCIFGFMLTISGLLLWIIGYIRFLHIADIQQKHYISRALTLLNKYSFYTGSISAFSCLIVANFQANKIMIVHIIGGSLCFASGMLYQIFQVVISFKVYPIIGHKRINILRLITTTISCVTGLITCVCGFISFSLFQGEDLTKWKAEDGGYVNHVISAASEYILVATTVVNLVSFVQEFRTIEIHTPVVTTRNVPV